MSSTPTPPITLLTTNHLALMLRSLRKRKGWTQADLAKRLNGHTATDGVVMSALAIWMNGVLLEKTHFRSYHTRIGSFRGVSSENKYR